MNDYSVTMDPTTSTLRGDNVIITVAGGGNNNNPQTPPQQQRQRRCLGATLQSFLTHVSSTSTSSSLHLDDDDDDDKIIMFEHWISVFEAYYQKFHPSHAFASDREGLRCFLQPEQSASSLLTVFLLLRCKYEGTDTTIWDESVEWAFSRAPTSSSTSSTTSQLFTASPFMAQFRQEQRQRQKALADALEGVSRRFATSKDSIASIGNKLKVRTESQDRSTLQ
eukprot:PhM_4_TR4510/c0_g1_i1/m.58658